MSHRCFVFGSNLAGIHGAGSAKWAYEHHGAIWGRGVGPNAEELPTCYAIPTKDERLQTLSLERIAPFVTEFRRYAGFNLKITFDVVAIGTGLAGYTNAQMAPLFAKMPSNVQLPALWYEILNPTAP